MGRQAQYHDPSFQPGKPQQNAYVERYNRTAHTVWLAVDPLPNSTAGAPDDPGFEPHTGHAPEDPSSSRENPELLMALVRERLEQEEAALQDSKYGFGGFRYKFWDDPEDQKRILARMDENMPSEWMTRASVLKLCDFLYDSGYGVARMEAIRAPYVTTPRNHGYEVTGLDEDEMWVNHFDPGRARALVHKKIKYAIDDEAEFIYQVWAERQPERFRSPKTSS